MNLKVASRFAHETRARMMRNGGGHLRHHHVWRKIKVKFYFVSIMLLAVLSVSGFSAQAKSIKASDITEITLKDDGGFGFDRNHEIVLRKDGTAEFFGGRNSYGRKGKYRGQFDERKFAQLAALLVKQKFFKLKDKYEAKALDAATVVTSVAYKGGRKTIQNLGFGGGPQLSALQNAIEAVANEIKWEKVEDGK